MCLNFKLTIYLYIAVLLVKQKKRYVLGFVTALYIAVVLNLIMENINVQLYLGFRTDVHLTEKVPSFNSVQNATSALAAIIADSLLVSIL